MGRAESETQFQPKVYGLYVLERILEGRQLDFHLLFSSSSAVLGGLGFVAYTAAHCFMDAFATARNQTSAAPWVSADWDLWPSVTRRDQGLQSSFDQYAMTPWEGQEAFRRVASLAPEGQVLVITGDLQARIDLWLRRKASARGRSVERHQRPALSHEYVAPQSATQKALAAIWSSVLGIEQIGLDDNFFELGGHSLLLPQIINGLRQALGIELPVRQLFEHTTIASLAELIDSGAGQASDTEAQPIAERILAAFPTERPELVKTYVTQKIALALGIDAHELAADGRLDRFDSEAYALDLLVHLKEDFKIQAFAPEIRRLPSVEAMTRFVLSELDRVTDMARLATTNPLSAYTLQPYRKQASEQFLVPPKKNRPLALVLSAPRAGSTIFRVMLAGHPQLFCPPELYLLHFETMREWDQNVGFGDSLAWNRQGLEWAYSELMGIDLEQSQAHVSALIERNAPVYEVYAELQELAGERLLVDKSPTYALDPEALARAERFFDRPKYMHLIRHPYTVMESILHARLDTLLGPNLFKEPDVDPYVVAETIWAASYRTVLQFLSDIPPEQQTLVRYEELVSDAAGVMTGLCAFLGIPFDTSVLNPYDDTQKRMVGGIGDPNIFKHKSINPKRGEAWRSIQLPRYLDESTRRVATQLGYELPGELAAPTSEALPPLNLDGLSDEEVDRLLSELLEKEGN
jgi:acyl carrier protein